MAHHSTAFLRTAAVFLAFGAAQPALGQTSFARSLVNEPGVWKPWTVKTLGASDLKTLGITRADASTVETRLQQIAQILRAAPVWNTPMGVDPSLSGGLFDPSSNVSLPRSQKYRPVASYIMMGSFEHFEVVDRGGAQEKRTRHVGGETSHIMIDVNWIPRGPGVNMLSDEEGDFFGEVVSTDAIGGFPTYDGMLVITKSTRPLWTPVSRERYLKAFLTHQRSNVASAEQYIADQEKQQQAFLSPAATAARQARYQAAIDKVAAKGAAAVERERRYWERDEADALTALRKRASRDPKVNSMAAVIAGAKSAEDLLAAMSPAERAGQACLLEDRADPGASGLVPMLTPKCMPLVSRNPNFFNPQLPRAVPQLIVVSRYRPLEKTWKEGRPTGETKANLDLWTTYEAFRQTDWQKVAELLSK